MDRGQIMSIFEDQGEKSKYLTLVFNINKAM
jgi:hypothetical protein